MCLRRRAGWQSRSLSPSRPHTIYSLTLDGDPGLLRHGTRAPSVAEPRRLKMLGIHPDSIPRDVRAPEILTEIIRYVEKPALASFIRVNKHFFECGVDELYKEIPGDRMSVATQAFRQGPRRARYMEAVQGVVTDEAGEDCSVILSTALLAFPNLRYVRSKRTLDLYGR